MDATALTGAVIFLSGTVFGAGLRSLPPRRHAPRPTVPTVPACQCGHPRALHDRATDQCHDRVPLHRGSSYYDRCPCRQYVGPEPLPSMFSTGIELPEGDA